MDESLQQRNSLPIPILVGYVLFFIGVSLHSLTNPSDEKNNFHIFTRAFEHLSEGKNIYQSYRDEGLDVFKYSPTFAMSMYPFTKVPYSVGIVLWNLVNVLVFYAGVNGLQLSVKKKVIILGICSLSLLGTTQNFQSNAMVAGTMILSFNALANERPVTAAMFMCIGAFTKPFVFAVAPCFLMFKRQKMFLTSLSAISLVFLLAPGFMTGFDALPGIYQTWFHAVAHHQESTMDYSLFRFLDIVTGANLPRAPILAVGLILLLAPLLKYSSYQRNEFRKRFIASILMWVVIFNNKAESPTYIIATLGAAIWFVSQPYSRWTILAIVGYLTLTDLAFSDVISNEIQDAIIKPYCVKAIPSFAIWAIAEWQLCTNHVHTEVPKSGLFRQEVRRAA